MASLRVISGPLVGQQIDVEHVITIGRHDADVVIDDPDLSRRHLEVRPHGDALIVEDLGSTNGTLVDGRRIDGPTHVGRGARLKLGSVVMEVEVAAAVQETRLSQRPRDVDATRVGHVPAQATPPAPAVPAPESMPAPPARPEPAAPAPAVAATGDTFGAFSPSSPHRGGGLASRSWIPVALSFGSAIATAIALVIYFAQR